MASFGKAIREILYIEGGYVNDPVDRGGETFMGISRNSEPDWEGWKVIDQFKGTSDFLEDIEHSKRLRTMGIDLYKERYWNVFQGDLITNQAVASEMLDISVNMGGRTAIRFFQIALNALNYSGADESVPSGADLEVDGFSGKKTIAAYTVVSRAGWLKYLVQMLNIQQGEKYISIVNRKPGQRKFLKGWLKRATIDSTDV